MTSPRERTELIRDILARTRPLFMEGPVLQAWREGLAHGVTEALIEEEKHISAARAEDQQRLFQLEYALDRYTDAIREHRNARMLDRRRLLNDEALYKLLPEGVSSGSLTGLSPDYVISDDVSRCRYPHRRYTSGGPARCEGGFTEEKCRCAQEERFLARLFRRPKFGGWLLAERWRFLRVILPAPPCWKGEVQIGYVVMWWQV
jgi:hypothetical protein